MLESSLITLREGFEAALIVAIVLGYLRRTGRAGDARAAWAGVGAALVVSVGLGLGLRGFFDGLEGDTRLRAFAVIGLGAAGVLTWMIFWMRRHARGLKGQLESRVGRAATTGSLVAVAAVTFLAVFREGIEMALFLVAATTGATDVDVVAGGFVGLLLAIGLAWLVHVAGRRIPMRTFFEVTGVLLILFAAGLVARAVQFLQASGDVGSVNLAVYDLTGVDWLTVHTQVGRFLAGIFGWDPRPSLEQAVSYLVYLLPVGVAFLWERLRLPQRTAGMS